MALQRPEPPAPAAEAVRSTLQAFAQQALFRTDALRRAQPERLALVEPHAVFSLGLGDLAGGAGTAAATPTGWRYLVRDGDRVIASADTIVTQESGTPGHVFSHFNESAFVASTAAAIETAGGLTQVAQGDFELRLLSVPALHTMALWLHEPGGGSDLLLPLAPSPIDAAPGRPYSAADLLRILTDHARALAAINLADGRGA